MLGQSGQAEWNALLGTAGFFGQYYLGGKYKNDKAFQAEVSVGSYIIEGEAGWQLNSVFRYETAEVEWSAARWKVVNLGIGFTYALIDLKNNKYFSRTPRQYPESDYYEQTALRGILELSSEVYFPNQHIEVGYYLRMLDKGLGAYYNSKNNNLYYYTSSGLALIFRY